MTIFYPAGIDEMIIFCLRNVNLQHRCKNFQYGTNNPLD